MLASDWVLSLIFVISLSTVMSSKNKSKRFRPDSSTDTSSIDDSLSYLDLDTGNVVGPTSTPSVGKGTSLSNKSYDALMQKLMKMETCLSKLDKLDKLDEIENSVRRMNSRIETFENRISKTESVVTDVEKSVTFVSEQYETMRTEQDTEKVKTKVLDKKVADAKTETDELKSALEEVKKMNAELKEEVLDLKSRSMRDNLIFRNIPEMKDENTEEVLTLFLSQKLNINNVNFERVHRMHEKKKKTQTVPRPKLIVAKFTFFKDRERVRKAAKMLKGTDFSIQEQFPGEIEARRKPLYPLLKAARKDEKRASMVKDRLFVEGKEVFAPKAQPDKSAPLTGTGTATGGAANV